MKLYIIGYDNGESWFDEWYTLDKKKAESVLEQITKFLKYHDYEIVESELEAPLYKVTELNHSGMESKYICDKPEPYFNMHKLISAEEIKP